jgi:hypothetical protein
MEAPLSAHSLCLSFVELLTSHALIHALLNIETTLLVFHARRSSRKATLQAQRPDAAV